MTVRLKTCYVRLNRDFLDSIKDLRISNLSAGQRKNSEYSYGSKNCMPSPSEINDGNNYRLKKKENVKYSEKNNNLCDETSHSEISADDNSSDNETTNSSRKKRKLEVSKTKEPKKINCVLCDKSFSTYPSYLTHKRTHQSKPFKCVLCLKTYENRQSYICHMKRYHPEVKPFICEYLRCQQSFKTQTLLRMHNKSHLKYMCKFCKKHFARKHHMRRHVLKIH